MIIRCDLSPETGNLTGITIGMVIYISLHTYIIKDNLHQLPCSFFVSNGIHDLSSRGHHGSRLSNGGSSSSSSRSRSRHHHHSAQQQQQQQRHQRNEIVDHQQHLDEGRNSYGDSDVSSHHSSSVHQSTSWQPAGRSHGR